MYNVVEYFYIEGNRRFLGFLKEVFTLPADLHCHTRLSDGSMGIDDLVLLAKNRGIDTIAITDHDCLAGNKRGVIVGERNGVNVIAGSEISATHRKSREKVHLLCYLSEYPDRLEGLCKRNLEARTKAVKHMVVRVSRRYPSTTPDLIVKYAAGSTSIYRQHIMHSLMECGVTDRIFGTLFEELFSNTSDKSVNLNAQYPEPKEIIDAIHEAEGIAVLAHPALFNNFDIIDELIELGLDGIEVWHPENSPEQTEMLREIAQRNHLLMTGGSDFHGMYGKGKVSVGACTTPDEHLNALLNYKSHKKKHAPKAPAAG